MCLCSFMAAEYDDLPEAVKQEVQAFADVNVVWLSKVLSAAGVVDSGESEQRGSRDLRRCRGRAAHGEESLRYFALRLVDR